MKARIWMRVFLCIELILRPNCLYIFVKNQRGLSKVEIGSIDALFFLVLGFLVTNRFYWCPFFSRTGFFGHQSTSLMPFGYTI